MPSLGWGGSWEDQSDAHMALQSLDTGTLLQSEFSETLLCRVKETPLRLFSREMFWGAVTTPFQGWDTECHTAVPAKGQ